ncbi:hypothetical protein NEF87_004328 [Candidatus Lokiarchaeum ossiferum]|uniref:RmlD-like substrate binding domain-containing protein n=1 Tax=Candidatus Lokiarchaeum ossiferum TaxID=2951803 RepID=A0ABY6HWZ3_9ARCH|nr:hypothetical protein NEF87_004328 [Candidatus Lokiarchaeum sp. B-35]
MKKIVIIGSNGQLGHDIKKILSNTYEIVSLEHNNFSIENEELVQKKLKEISPEIVINTAAFHNLNLCEIDVQNAFLINSIALKYLSDTCNQIEATLVHFSTDYVFGGDSQRNSPYREKDFPYPIQIYGISKLAGENIIRQYCKKYFCIRVSGLYGKKGTRAKKFSNFVEMMIKLGRDAEKANEKLPSAMDQVLTFNPTVEVAKVVEKLIKTDAYGLYHATCEGQSSRFEFSQEIFKILDINVELVGVKSSYFSPKYNQPHYSVLDNEKLSDLGIEMPHWKPVLKKYLKD